MEEIKDGEYCLFFVLIFIECFFYVDLGKRGEVEEMCFGL